ncbi:MAG: hypothetical protein AB7O43_13620 [Hyphomicrobiaceae bacterium]
MDQRTWDEIYDHLESELDSAATRSTAADVEAELAVILDRARFAIDRGEDIEAIGALQDLQERLEAIAPQDALRRDGSASTIDRLRAIEDELHENLRLGSARLEVVGEEEEPTRSASRNVKVNRSTAFANIEEEYIHLFETARVLEEHRSTVQWYSSRILKNRATYEQIERETGVPWWFTGLIHGMECSFSMSKHLHNGDPLTARTRQVPAGRPKSGSPPFTFVVSACDALDYEGFAGEDDWTIARVLYRFEKYNGFGYRQKYGTVSPYLWSFCNHYVAGKYVRDGVYDPDAVSKQCGTAATLRDLMEAGHISFAPAKPEPEPAAPIAPPSAAIEAPQTTEPTDSGTPAATPASQPAAAVQPDPVPTPAPAPAAQPAEAPQATPASAPSATEAQLTQSGLSSAVAAALATLVDAARPESGSDGARPDDAAGSDKPGEDETASKL